MPDYNPSVALGVNASPLNLQSTIGTLAQIQLANAHAGLYGLQAQQEARKLAGLSYLKENPTDYLGAIQRGLDPSVGSTLQGMAANERAYAVTPNNLAPQAFSELAAAGRSQAETAKTNLETRGIGMGQGAQIAQGVIADPGNNSVWQNAVDQHYRTFGGSPLERQQLLNITDRNLRLQIAKAYAAQGVSPSTFGTPHAVEPTAAITTPGASYTTVPPANQQGGMIGAPGERIIGGSIVSDNGVPMPNQQVAGRFGTLPPAMSVQGAAEAKAYGGELAKQPQELAAAAQNARQGNFILDQMRQESQSWPMGKGSTAFMTAQQYLKPLANSLGSDVFDKPVADYESFQKNTGTLVRQAVKEVSSRAAVQEFNLIQAQLPSAEMSRRGFGQIADQFQAVNDYKIAKQQAAQAWLDSRGTMNKFDAEWNKNITPTAFLVARLPPEELGALKANLERTPQGRAALASIKSQLQWAHSNRLDELLK